MVCMQTHPYSGTQVMTAFLSLLILDLITRSQAFSKKAFSSANTGSSGAGHWDAWVVPIRA